MTKILRLVAINLAVLFGAAIVLELFFGAWFSDADLGALNLPRNVHYRFDVSQLYGRPGKINYSRDNYGLRGRYSDPSKIDILTIGGSTTNQLYIDDNETWQAEMERLFKEAGQSLVMVNASVDGQSSRGHIAVFDRWFPSIPGLKSRYVLAYVGINDVAVDEAQQWDQMESNDASRRFRNWIINRSAVYNLFRTVRGMIRAYDAKLVYGTPTHDGKVWLHLQPVAEPPIVRADLAVPTAAYAERLKVLIGKIRQFGAEAILVTQPTAEFRVRGGWIWGEVGPDEKPDGGAFEIMSAFNQTTLRICRELKAVCLDLASAVEFEDGDFYDRVHNTPKGAAKVGRYLFEQLRGRLSAETKS